jgi:hypothetical protein
MASSPFFAAAMKATGPGASRPVPFPVRVGYRSIGTPTSEPHSVQDPS